MQRQIGVSVCFWVGWGLILGSSIIRRPWGLTVIRVLTPTTLPALLAAQLYSHISTGILVVALTHATLASLLSLLPETGNAMVDGLSYGDEKRFLLRVPSAIAIGPLILLWAVVVLGLISGPITVASENWIIGILLIGILSVSKAYILRKYSPACYLLVGFSRRGTAHDEMDCAELLVFPMCYQ